jgi:hypothetical protein
MTRHRAIIKRLGGHEHLANVLGLATETVKSWMKRDRGIPPRYWNRLASIDPSLTSTYLERTHPLVGEPRHQDCQDRAA